MKNNTLMELTDSLSSHYKHILGEVTHDEISSHSLIERIVSYYEDIINCMPGNVYWIDKNCITAGCNKNVYNKIIR